MNSPDEEKFRRLRLSNPKFHVSFPNQNYLNLLLVSCFLIAVLFCSEKERVGCLKGGVEFLELCGFEWIDGDRYLFLPRAKVDMEALRSAGLELHSALTNPFFGLLSVDGY